jgi:hypothetical protein
MTALHSLRTRFMKLLLARKTSVGSYTLVWAGTQPTPTGAYSENCEVSEYVLAFHDQFEGIRLINGRLE